MTAHEATSCSVTTRVGNVLQTCGMQVKQGFSSFFVVFFLFCFLFVGFPSD
jgi:hypothetical protein